MSGGAYRKLQMGASLKTRPSLFLFLSNFKLDIANTKL